MRGELARKGQLIDQPDLFIAATAIQHNLMLVTRNIKDYERIPNLEIYTLRTGGDERMEAISSSVSLGSWRLTHQARNSVLC
jgi:hypothetical protein